MKTNRAIFSSWIIVTLFAVGVLSSCQNSISPGGNNPPTSSQTGSITGKVVTTNNMGISGIEVRVGNISGYTDSKGQFFLASVPAGERVLVNFNSDLYTSTQKVTVVKANRTSYLEASVITVGTKQTLDGGTGGQVQFSGAKVVIPANSVVDSKGAAFTGSFQVKATYFDPTAAQFTGCFPGEFSGVRTTGTETAIESFGYISVELLNGTEKLQIASGKTSTITLPIPASKLAAAPQSIPLWYYDESKGKWIEDGFATKTGNTYVGTVSHFSNWNCDQPQQTSFLEGNVVDQNGKPVSFANVHSEGVDYTGSAVVHTDDAGYFKLPVKSSASAKVWANYHIFASTKSTIATPATGIINNIGNIVLPIDTTNICTIVGRVIDNGGLPVANMYVNLKDEAGKQIDYVTTSKDGKFKFIGELGKKYAVEIQVHYDSSSTPKHIDVQCPNQSETIDLGDVKLDLGGSTIIGRVVDASGNPLADVYIYSAEVPQGSPNGGREMKTDATGKFSLWVRPNKALKINFYGKPSGQKVLDVTSGNLGETKDIGDVTLP